MNLAPICASCIFSNQYIMEKVLSCLVILWSYFLQYLMLLSITFSLDFWVCEYVDAEFLILSGKTSANSLETYYFLHINAKLFDVLSMLAVTKFRWRFSRCFLTSGSLSTSFVCLDFIFLFKLSYFFFHLG